MYVFLLHLGIYSVFSYVLTAI